MCHVSHVTCHVSRVTCQMSGVFFFFYIFYYIYINLFYKKNLQSDGASWWRVCYQRGLPRLVYLHPKEDDIFISASTKYDAKTSRHVCSCLLSLLSLFSLMSQVSLCILYFFTALIQLQTIAFMFVFVCLVRWSLTSWLGGAMACSVETVISINHIIWNWQIRLYFVSCACDCLLSVVCGVVYLTWVIICFFF